MERFQKYHPGRKMSELIDRDKVELFTDIVQKTAEFKNTSVSEKELTAITKDLLYFVNKRYKHLTTGQMISAFEFGLMGEYGKSFTKVSASIINEWFAEITRQISRDITLKNSSENFERNYENFKITDPDNLLYGEACIMRLVYDPCRVICEENNWTLDDVVDGIKKGMNIFTAEDYDKEELISKMKKNRLTTIFNFQ
jgi:hypothetical protein